MTLYEKQSALVDYVNHLGDCFDQYTYLISRAAALPPMPEELHTAEYLVKGCQSQVWLALCPQSDGTFHLYGDSDTLILKGILELFAQLVDGCSPEEVNANPWDFLQKTELTATFSSSRMAGIAAIIQKIKAQAANN